MVVKSECQYGWSRQQLAHWCVIQQAYESDIAAVVQDKNVDRRRYHVRQEMTQLLYAFLDGAITLTEFNEVFQQKTRGPWSVFSLGGMSGSMFLRKLIKHIPDQDELSDQLRIALRLPLTSEGGKQQMVAFLKFLEERIDAQETTRKVMQPARTPFFLSGWWHLQDREQWPLFYPIVSTVVMYQARRPVPFDQTEAYFLFRRWFLLLTKEFDMTTWKLEHVATWYGLHTLSHNDENEELASLLRKRRNYFFVREDENRRRSEWRVLAHRGAMENESNDTPEEEAMYDRSHTHIQWLLAQLGRKIGCTVWVAEDDQSKTWRQKRLGDISLETLPILADSAFQCLISTIDVLWFVNNTIVAAYEIEPLVDTAASLLRLYDLARLFPGQDMYLCVVAPGDCLKRVAFELSRPSFQEDEIRKRCVIIDESLLLENEAHILRWASSPDVIKRMACTDVS